MQLAIRADVFHRALKTTTFAASRDFDFKRPAFSGVLLDVSPTAFRVVATDGYRLALFETDDGYDCREPVTAVLSARELVELKLPRASNVIFKIAINDTEAVVQHKKAGFSVPVIQAQYPYYFDVFPPAQQAITLSCEKTAFLKALKSAMKDTTRENRNVFFWARPGLIALAAEDPGIIFSHKLAAQCDYSVFGVFNSTYLRDALRALPSGGVQIRFTPPDEGRPIFSPMELSSADRSGNVIRHLVMACRRPFIPALPGVDS